MLWSVKFCHDFILKDISKCKNKKNNIYNMFNLTLKQYKTY